MKTKLTYFFTVAVCAFSLSGVAISQATTSGNVAVIESDALSAPTGIKKLTRAFATIEAQFKPLQNEISSMRARFDQLQKELGSTQDSRLVQQKADQADTLKREIERKQYDGEASARKRSDELTRPIYDDISSQLRIFGKAKGFDIVLDLSKMSTAVFVINDAVNMTSAFIADYNSKNP